MSKKRAAQLIRIGGERLLSKEMLMREGEEQDGWMDRGEAEVGRQRRIKWRRAHDGLAGLQRLSAAIQLLVKATLKSLLAVPTILGGEQRARE